MTCHDAKKELALGMLGLGSPDKQKELEIHAVSCPDCAKKIEKARSAKAVISNKEQSQFPDWEASWRVIDAQVLRGKRPRAFPALRNRWAFAAVIATVFILGAAAGRLFLFKPKPAPLPDIFAGMSPASAWRDYADRLEFLLVDFGNQAEVEQTREIIQQEKALIERLLAETRALKTLLEIQGDDARAALLNDAELTLAKIANLKPGDIKSSEEMAKIVRESPLKSKLRAIKSSDVIL